MIVSYLLSQSRVHCNSASKVAVHEALGVVEHMLGRHLEEFSYAPGVLLMEKKDDV